MSHHDARRTDMYIVIRRYRVDPDDVDEAFEFSKNRVLPELIKIPGFRGYYNVHSGQDTVVSISIFSDKHGADESTRIAREMVRESARDLLPLPPEVIEGEVVTSEVLESFITPKPTVA